VELLGPFSSYTVDLKQKISISTPPLPPHSLTVNQILKWFRMVHHIAHKATLHKLYVKEWREGEE
jgi:hypothetical protein